MIREKARNLINLLKEGTGSATIFGSSYYDEETQKIIEIITNECKSTIVKENGERKKYESDIYFNDIREIVQQLLTDKNTIKNSLVSKLTSIPNRNIAGIMKPIQVFKKMNNAGIPYLEVDTPLPDNFNQIISGEDNRKEFLSKIIKPYIAKLCKNNTELSKRHIFSKMFSPLSKKEITNQELIERMEGYLKANSNLNEEKIHTVSQYFISNVLENPSIMQDVINDEIQGNSLQVIGEKHKSGYNGMIQNMSNNLLDILTTVPNPNDGLREVEDIYANIVGQLEALSIEPEKNPELIESQIKNINRNINRHRQEYYSQEGYRKVDVGFGGRDIGLLKKEYVPQAMKLYSEQVSKLLEQSQQMDEEQYIKEVAKLHFRFVRIHPFPDGNGRTARAISNMLLLEKNMAAVFTKENKDIYMQEMNWLNSNADGEYNQSLYTDQQKCSKIEEERVYKLEEYIGIKCLDKSELYKNRGITEELPRIDLQEENELPESR